MGFYDRLASTSLRLLSKFGQEVTRREFNSGAYRPETSLASQTTIDTVRRGVLLDLPPSNTHGPEDMIEQDHKQLLIDPSGPVFLTDEFIVSGKTYSVTRVSELNPSGTVLLYDLRVKG